MEYENNKEREQHINNLYNDLSFLMVALRQNLLKTGENRKAKSKQTIKKIIILMKKMERLLNKDGYETSRRI